MKPQTAEEFTREKIRAKNSFPEKYAMEGLQRYSVTGEECLRWAHEFSQLSAIHFQNWIVDNDWQVVHSESLNKRAYVDSSTHDIFLHGSDLHYTNLIEKHGKTIQELFNIYKDGK